jgi:hypothetical protein
MVKRRLPVDQVRRRLVDQLAEVIAADPTLLEPGRRFERLAEAATLVAAARLTAAELREWAARDLAHAVRDQVRTTAREAEQAAARPKVKRLPEPEPELWLGRFRHGSVDVRIGAVDRDCPCPTCTEVRRSRDKLQAKAMAQMTAATEAYARHLRMEWTAELLATGFPLPDGTRTTWGAATVDQHRARVAMFEGQAVAAVESAARHRKAIDALHSSGASCLAELAERAA